MTAHRRSTQVLLSSEAGVQRLVRATPNKLNRVSLLPREPPQPWPPTVVDWFDHAWWLDVHRSDVWFVRVGGVVVGDGLHPLEPGTRLLLGSTPVTFEVHEQRWPADLEKERALLTRDDDGAWQVFCDELLERSDPLGRFFSEKKSEDVAWLLEVLPLLASQRVTVASHPNRPWHQVRFEHELFAGRLHEGVVASVLEHPFAWFVREVRVAFTAGDEFDAEFDAQAHDVVKAIDRAAGPHLASIVFENGAHRRAPPAPRAGVSVSTVDT